MKYTNKIKIAVCGSAHGTFDQKVRYKAYRIGQKLAENKCILITGATLGYPEAAAKGAFEAGGMSVGISPADGKSNHIKKWKYPYETFDPIIYTGFGLQGRNVILIRSSDAVIFIGGGSGTLNEFTTAFRLGKPLGILKNSGKLSEYLPTLKGICSLSSTSPSIIHSDDPEKLVESVMQEARKYIEKNFESC